MNAPIESFVAACEHAQRNTMNEFIKSVVAARDGKESLTDVTLAVVETNGTPRAKRALVQLVTYVYMHQHLTAEEIIGVIDAARQN